MRSTTDRGHTAGENNHRLPEFGRANSIVPDNTRHRNVRSQSKLRREMGTGSSDYINKYSSRTMAGRDAYIHDKHNIRREVG